MSHPGPEPGKHTNKANAVLDQMGGVSGLIYSSLPVLVFVPISSLFGLLPAIGAALGVAALILVWRLARRESAQPAISGFIGVGVCALIAYVMGESKGYFLLGIWSSLFWATVFAISVLIRRPVVGYIWGWVNGHDRGWRRVRRAVLAFDIATLTWVLVFGSRFVVQQHLYDADQTGWLGVARIAMGWPLTAVAALVTYLAIRAAQRALHAHAAADTAARPTLRTRCRNPVDRAQFRPATHRGRGSGLLRGVPGRLGGQPRAAGDQPGIRRRPGAAAVGGRRIPAHTRRAHPGCGRDLRCFRPAVGAARGPGRLRGVVAAVCVRTQRLGAGRRPLFAGCRRRIPGPELAGDDQRPLLRRRPGPRHRHLDRLDGHRVRHRPALGRCPGRCVELAVGLRGQHRPAGHHLVPDDEAVDR